MDRNGPVDTGFFTVTIDQVAVSGWKSVTLPSSVTAESETGRWGETTFDDLKMERGFFPGGVSLTDWRDDIRQDNTDTGAKDVTVTLNDENNQPQIRWEFTGAWIRTYDPPTLDATADDDVATETMTLAFENNTTDTDVGSDDTEQPPPVVGSTPPGDIDGNGRYEDINGDATADLLDVRKFFTERTTETVQNNPEAFDFNSDGRINLLDVRELFNELR
jgi:phage tail-like protein